MTQERAWRLIRAWGIQVIGIICVVTQLTVLIVIGAILFMVGFALYLVVEGEFAHQMYDGYSGLLDPRRAFLLRIQLWTIGLWSAVRVLRNGETGDTGLPLE